MAETLCLRQRLDLTHCADCAERRPLANGAPLDGETVALALATYELDKTTNVRRGQIVPCTLTETEDHKPVLTPKADLEELAGVFDIKWNAEGSFLASAHADGTCQIRNIGALGKSKPTAGVQLKDEDEDDGEPCFALSLDWNDRAGCAPGETQLAVSRSDGKLSIIAVRESTLDIVDSWSAHAYPGPAPAEVWITAFDCFDPNVLISGADEGKLKVWDLRVGGSMPIATCTQHDAGVCSTQFHPRKPNVFVTGSYDSRIRLWDRRNLKEPTVAPLDTEGGVWRLKWHPTDDDRLLSATMRSGFLDMKVTSEEIRITQFYNEGFTPGRWESLGYGADWLHVQGQTEDYVIGASFYDRHGYLFACSP